VESPTDSQIPPLVVTDGLWNVATLGIILYSILTETNTAIFQPDWKVFPNVNTKYLIFINI
jgi:hypothetical protein